MSVKQRLPAEVRKKAIRDCAKKVFLNKGFKDTTMEDVIAKAGMSKGGVYRYYKSTSEMLYDIMDDGNIDRDNKTNEFLAKNSDMNAEELAIEVAVMKMIDKAEYKPLYAMFLVEAEKNSKLKELATKIKEKYKKKFFNFIENRKLHQLSCFVNEEWIALVDSIIVATEVLDVRNVFLKHKELFRDIIRQYIEKSKEKL